ncbi:MAG: hypothetical protein SNJ57_19455 [Cyanobacteriota bacterium]
MISVNDRVLESRSRLADLPMEILRPLCDVLLEEMGEPSDSAEKEAIALLERQQYDEAKRLCLSDPCNPYLAAISCIASAWRSPMVADSVLRDAARHAADVAKRRAERRIAIAFARVLSN